MTNNWSLYDGFIKHSKGHFQISASTSRMEMKFLGTSWLNTEICKISSQLPVRSVFNMPICRLLKMPLYWDQRVVLISNLTWRYFKKKRIDCHQKKQPSEVFYKKKLFLEIWQKEHLFNRTPLDDCFCINLNWLLDQYGYYRREYFYFTDQSIKYSLVTKWSLKWY